MRQFRHLSKQLNRLLESGQFYELSDSRQKGLLIKLRRLYRKLREIFSFGYLRKALAGAALLLGLSQTGQAQTFGPEVVTPFNFQNTLYFNFPTFVDIDNDGDMDLIQHFYDFTQADSRVYYQENTGTAEAPAFGSPVQEPSGIFFDGYYFVQPAFADLDNDGDPDLFVGTYYEYGGLSFFQNLLLETGTEENSLEADVALFPNLASGISNLQIAFPEAPGELEITLVDIHGRTQRQWQQDGVADRFATQLDLSGLSPGMYFVRLRSGVRFATLRIMLE